MNWIIVITLFHISTQTTILIDHNGSNTLSCCASFQSCPCSNLSLALEIVKNGTEIKLMSDISLMYVTRFGNISNVTITGHDHSIQCNHQGGLVGENIGSIAIQGVMWDHCRGVSFQNFNDVCIFNCTFQHSVASYALKLVGRDSIFIGNSTCSFNDGAVQANALSIDIQHSNFYSNGFREAIYIDGSTPYLVNFTLANSVFTSNSGPSLFCNGNSQISIDNSNFVNNFYSAVVLKTCHMLLKDDVTFSNNTVTVSNDTYCGAAIYSSDSTLNISGSVYFLSNKALHQGGAVYLLNSIININNGLVKFDQNTANMGGVIYADLNSNISVNQNAVVEFTNNSALYGGALYVIITSNPYRYNPPEYQGVISYYYNLLATLNYLQSNTAKIAGILVYFQYDFDSDCIPERLVEHKSLFSSSPCRMIFFDAFVILSDYNSSTVLFGIKNLKFSAIIVDYFNNFVGTHNVTLSCKNYYCNDAYHRKYDYTIDSIRNDVILLDGDTMACCNTRGNTISVFVDTPFHLTKTFRIQLEEQNCSDILHRSDCDLIACLSLQTLDDSVRLRTNIPPGFQCHGNELAVTPGYWYHNGLSDYVISCPPEYCDFTRWNTILSQTFPDHDLQCRDNWKGFSCGECSHDNHAIGYGSTDCILLENCSISSTPLSLFVLFVVSFLYWCLVIAFIFFLLHFRFNVIAGHAFGVIFYYSILAQVVSVINKVNQLRYCAIAADDYVYKCYLPQGYAPYILPFLFSIGTLKPPFMQYLKLCLGGAEMVDHIVLDYIHPLIVFSIVAIIFVCSRKFVWAARLVGRYINSKSICLLILLSYSSISYTSVQLLRPLAYFNYDYFGSGSNKFSGLKPYWSPNIDYFGNRHSYYVILALLMVVLVGFGFPFWLLFQTYLTRRHNMNFISIRPIIDQLQACYRNDCYWFSAYYLICRQVIYGVDIVCDFLFAIFMQNEEYTFAKFIMLLVLSILILAIHLIFQPYRLKSLNILDGAILLTLVLLLVASLDGKIFLASVLFWVLPLIIFINCLAYSTKAQHFVVFSSVCGLIVLLYRFFFFIEIFAYNHKGIVFILCLLLLLSILVGYIIYVLKKVITKVRPHAQRNLELVPVVNFIRNDSDGSNEEDDNL